MIHPVDKFWIDGKCSDFWDLYCDTIIFPQQAEQITREIQIPGREETLIEKEDSYADIPITITAYVFDKNYNVNALYSNVRKAEILKTSYDGTIYYKIKRTMPIIPQYEGNGKTKLVITFMCSPFRYLNESVITLTEYGTVTNPTNYWSRPTFRIYGSGTVKLRVNDSVKALEIRDIEDCVTVDTERVIVYDNDKKIYYTTGNFPLFPVGESSVYWDGNVTRVQILPNWRWL